LVFLACVFAFNGCGRQSKRPSLKELYAALGSEPAGCELLASKRELASDGKDSEIWIILSRKPIELPWDRDRERAKDRSARIHATPFPIVAMKNVLADCAVPASKVPNFELSSGRMIEWEKLGRTVRIRECSANGTSTLSAIDFAR